MVNLNNSTVSEKREQEILLQSLVIYRDNEINTIQDIFNIEISLDDFTFIEKFYLQSCLMVFHKYGSIEKIPTSVKVESHLGGLVEINKRFSGKMIEGVTKVSFDSLYPSMILSEEEELCNLKGLREVYEDLFLDYKKNKDGSDKYERIKEYINSMYGILGTLKPNSLIKTNIDTSIITRRSMYLLSTLKREFEGHYIYIDTDSIYFLRYNEIKDRLDEELDKMITRNKYLTYEITHHNKGIFLHKKKHILFDEDGSLKTMGIKSIQ